ncbi:hypothetical protein FNV43_RR21755 [Rhamnella rubrinervis]|uniref:Uncharacterized protein n=1 Tax=Rhamnella rubrinervis TaxID=2594499 RepID=A0A8K0DVQ9_9ROSA|nr:hypothetical protein FNV43_RR21755 [Rhamnella rubrinervis]
MGVTWTYHYYIFGEFSNLILVYITRLANQKELKYYSEIERTTHRLKKETLRLIAASSPSATLQCWIQSREFDSEDELKLAKYMNNNKTLKELAASDLNSQSLCLEFLDLTTALN